MPKFNEYALEMSIMELFIKKELIYLSDDKNPCPNTNVSYYDVSE